MRSIWTPSPASLMVLVRMFIARLNMATAGQIVPQYNGFDGLPNYINYTSSGYEWLVALAGIGFTGFAFLQGERLFGRVFTDQDAH